MAASFEIQDAIKALQSTCAQKYSQRNQNQSVSGLHPGCAVGISIDFEYLFRVLHAAAL
jgi:hypothetical protein